MSKIISIKAREILDSRGNPTLEVEVRSEKAVGRAMVPSGASTGKHEVLELRDNDKKRFGGKGVLKACSNVNLILAKLLKGISVDSQEKIDRAMIKKDGTVKKSKLGANAILGVSMAVARCAAEEKGIELFEYLNPKANLLPLPWMNILNGGKHADSGLEFQELMIVPVGAKSIHEAVRMGAEVFHTLGGILKEMGYKITVGDEGGYAPKLGSVEHAFELILKAVKKAGYREGKDFMIAIDPAASEFYNNKKGVYDLTVNGKKEELSSNELVDYILKLTQKFPIISVEDGLAEDDFAGWKVLKAWSKGAFQIVGDDLFVTNAERLKKGIELDLANSILIKLNQVGTLTETIETIEIAKKNNWTTVVSHRSGETEDSFIADLAVAMGCGQMKTGSMSRSERICKYNRLMKIEDLLGKKAKFLGIKAFSSI